MKSETQRLRRTKSIGNEEGLQEGRKKKKKFPIPKKQNG